MDEELFEWNWENFVKDNNMDVAQVIEVLLEEVKAERKVPLLKRVPVLSELVKEELTAEAIHCFATMVDLDLKKKTVTLKTTLPDVLKGMDFSLDCIVKTEVSEVAHRYLKTIAFMVAQSHGSDTLNVTGNNGEDTGMTHPLTKTNA